MTTFMEWKFQLVLQWWDSCKQSSSLCVKALSHYLMGWEWNSSLSSCSAVFCLADQIRKKYLFPSFWNVRHGRLSSAGLIAVLMRFKGRGNGHWSGFGRAEEVSSLLRTSLDGRGGTACIEEEKSATQLQGCPSFWLGSTTLICTAEGYFQPAELWKRFLCEAEARCFQTSLNRTVCCELNRGESSSLTESKWA